MKKIFTFITILCISKSLFSLPFNNNLKQNEIEKLQNGETLIKSIDKYKNISIDIDKSDSKSEGINKIRNEIKDLNPNYLAEIIQIRPFEENEDLLDKMQFILEDIKSYAGIPYWSVQHERYWDLYEKASVLEIHNISPEEKLINADLYMEPFGTIHSPIRIYRDKDYLLYVSENNNTLKFEGKITCIQKKHMKSAILVFRDGENWILYGLGGCNTMKVPMFQERIERSFINRIKTFCNYVFTKL